MSDKLSHTIEQLQSNPLQVLKDFVQEKKKLQTDIIQQSPIIDDFVNLLVKNYTIEDLESLGGKDLLKQTIHDKILSSDPVDTIASFVPGLQELKTQLSGLTSMFGGGSDAETLVDEFVHLIKAGDKTETKKFLTSHGISTAPSTTTPKKTLQEVVTLDNDTVLDDEENIKDNTNYDYDFKKNSKFSDSLEKYISVLPTFTSVGYQVDAKTKTTLCSRTAFQDAEKLFGLKRPEGNAFDVMREAKGDFTKSIVSKQYEESEKNKTRVDEVVDTDKMGDSAYINTIAGKNNVVDLYVTSSTEKGKKFGHRVSMFRIGDQRFVIDPYTVLQPGEQKDKPRSLESYALSMKSGKNKREFMRMNFYESSVLDSKLNTIVASLDDANTLKQAA